MLKFQLWVVISNMQNIYTCGFVKIDFISSTTIVEIKLTIFEHVWGKLGVGS